MRSSAARRVLIVCTSLMILAMPIVGSAQEAVLAGAVTDSTGGVLPGVAVKAQHEASGNTFETVTDARGAYSIPVRIGVYKITAGLQGFGTVTRSVEVLVGQTAVISRSPASGKRHIRHSTSSSRASETSSWEGSVSTTSCRRIRV